MTLTLFSLFTPPLPPLLTVVAVIRLCLMLFLSTTHISATSTCVVERLVRGIERQGAGGQSDLLQLREHVRSALRGRPGYVGVERMDKVSGGMSHITRGISSSTHHACSRRFLGSRKSRCYIYFAIASVVHMLRCSALFVFVMCWRL